MSPVLPGAVLLGAVLLVVVLYALVYVLPRLVALWFGVSVSSTFGAYVGVVVLVLFLLLVWVLFPQSDLPGGIL